MLFNDKTLIFQLNYDSSHSIEASFKLFTQNSKKIYVRKSTNGLQGLPNRHWCKRKKLESNIIEKLAAQTWFGGF
jgi:hypothetical protein